MTSSGPAPIPMHALLQKSACVVIRITAQAAARVLHLTQRPLKSKQSWVADDEFGMAVGGLATLPILPGHSCVDGHAYLS